MLTWTTEQITSLAPDTTAAKHGRALALPAKWHTLHGDGRALWGTCPGSGARIYQTQIDLSEPAFKCTCPSPAHPCKHALALFLIYSDHPQAFHKAVQPPWVNEWLGQRDQQPAKRSVADSAAQARRANQRHAKIMAGLDELDLWLSDLVRSGMADLPQRPRVFWDATIARMVDAQAGEIARELREIATLAQASGDWANTVLARLGRLHLIIQGFRHYDTLPEAVQTDLRTAVGWSPKAAELADHGRIRDVWSIIGRRVDRDGKLSIQRTWLWGQTTGKYALILHYAHGKQTLDASLIPGTQLDASLIFYPSASPLRALVAERHADHEPLRLMAGYTSITAAINAYASALGRNPWLGHFPFGLTQVSLQRQGEGWFLLDRPQGNHQSRLPLKPLIEKGWHLHALSGGRPLVIFGEWDGEHLLPLSALAEGRWLDLRLLRGVK